MSAPGQTDGYSVFVHLLPYIEEIILYDDLASATGNFQPAPGPFSDAIADNPLIDEDGIHFSQRQLSAYRCPSYNGDTLCLADADYAGGNVVPAVGNYVAIVATDLEGVNGRLPSWKSKYKHWENGGLVSSCAAGDCDGNKGLALRDIADGVSKQIILTESNERAYASWMSSASTWVVAATGGTNPRESQGVLGVRRSRTGKTTAELISGHLALNWGDSTAYGIIGPNANHSVYLMPAEHRWAGKQPRLLGPASDHSGSVVLHVFGDAHAKAISSDVDPQIYLRFITRADGDDARTEDL